tara:strand:- start:6524 stop:6892 length:369 start_codon:yes stop_codon:yes gene_type:complete
MALTKKYAWWTERARLALVEEGGTGGWQSPTTSDMTIRILASAKATDFGVASDEDATTSAFPPQFHKAIVYWVIAELYRDPRNLDLEMAEYYMKEYDKIVKMAKHYGKRGNIGFGQIRGQQF